MTATLLDGKAIARDIRAGIKRRAAALVQMHGQAVAIRFLGGLFGGTAVLKQIFEMFVEVPDGDADGERGRGHAFAEFVMQHASAR